MFHADRRKDMKKLTVAFRSFANAPKRYPNFESKYFQLCITTLRAHVTNEQIGIVISLTFSLILDLSQHSILLNASLPDFLPTSFMDKGPALESKSYSPDKVIFRLL